MTIRKATFDDTADIRRVYNKAKEYMNASGNPDQWEIGYPPEEVLKDDIESGNLYVICEDTVKAVFAFIRGIDSTYITIDGKWLRDAPYCAMHRIASDGTIKGVFHIITEYCKKEAGNGTDLKVDTHHDNKTMQHVIKKEGFVECGIIHLENGDPRIAYQLIN